MSKNREDLREKIEEITRGFNELADKIDDIPDKNVKTIAHGVDDFRFRYAKVLNLSPDGDTANHTRH